MNQIPADNKQKQFNGFQSYLFFLVKLLYYIYTKKNKYDNVNFFKKLWFLMEDISYWFIEFFMTNDIIFDAQTKKSLNIVDILQKILLDKDISQLSSFRKTLEYNHLRFKNMDNAIFITETNERIIVNVDDLYNHIQNLLAMLIASGDVKAFDLLFESIIECNPPVLYYMNLYRNNSLKID